MKYIEEVNPGTSHYPILIYIILCLRGEDGDVKNHKDYRNILINLTALCTLYITTDRRLVLADTGFQSVFLVVYIYI